jgi:protein-S-isoprenylcysteine O-methyltransferase Ste14
MNATTMERLLVGAFVLIALGLRVGEMWRKQGTERGQTSMLWSFYALVGVGAVVYAGAVLEFYFVPRTYHLALGLMGMVLYGMAVGLRLAAIRALGRHWSLHIEIRERHPLIQEGPYRWIRHPAYASFVLETAGVPLVANAWWSLLIAVVVYVPLLCWRIQREERALVAKLGDVYRHYQREVGMLLPRIAVFYHRNNSTSSAP